MENGRQALPPSGAGREPAPIPQPDFLPICRRDMENLGWEELDILLIQGDAYLDLPAQGPALLGRWLVAHGFKVGLISQPRWRDRPEAEADLTAMGRPRLFAALSAGSMDSMLAHYTAFRKLRRDDALTPGGQSGARPNRATLVYTGLVRSVFPALPVFIGGLEASLRRLSHYDFWQDKLRPSVLLESKADLLIYGPGERPLLEAARRLAASGPAAVLGDIPGTLVAVSTIAANDGEALILPSHEEILAEPGLLMKATLMAEEIVHQGGPAAFQRAAQRIVRHNPPARLLTTEDLDFIYALPFSRRAHPLYSQPVPALEMLATSITTHRGCGGGCSFCSLALHQGRRVSSRSESSILSEAEALSRLVAAPAPGRGASKAKAVALSDVGAATANLWGAKCLKGAKPCRRSSCLWPGICPHLSADQGRWVGLLKKLRRLEGVKQVRVASGVRYDLAMVDTEALMDFLRDFAGGQLKVAPEHLDANILKLMRKPGPEVFKKFLELFDRVAGPGRFVIPYLISAFPGSDLGGMKALAGWFRRRRWRPRQVQAFIPTPGTVATAMYYGGVDEEGRPLAVARSDAERLSQHAFLAPGPAPFRRPSK